MKKYLKNVQNSQLTRVRIADSWLTMINGNSLYYINIANYDDEDESIERIYTKTDIKNAAIVKNMARLESKDSNEKFIDCKKLWDGYQQHYEKDTTMRVAYQIQELEHLVQMLKAMKVEHVLFEIPKGDYPTRISNLNENNFKVLLVSLYNKHINREMQIREQESDAK